MVKYIIIIIIIIAALGAGVYFMLATRSGTEDDSVNGAEVLSGAADVQLKTQADRDLAVAKAYELYRQAIIDDIDLSDGPCLSNQAIEDWVVDVAHDPRQDVDNDPANQCSGFRSGAAKHFVELDPQGNLIRAE
ncbi:MAG: hypothetical protein ACOYUK_05315 [Patescibacteria group bacterium]